MLDKKSGGDPEVDRTRDVILTFSSLPCRQLRQVIKQSVGKAAQNKTKTWFMWVMIVLMKLKLFSIVALRAQTSLWKKHHPRTGSTTSTYIG
jgi:hypothetical protein